MCLCVCEPRACECVCVCVAVCGRPRSTAVVQLRRSRMAVWGGARRRRGNEGRGGEGRDPKGRGGGSSEADRKDHAYAEPRFSPGPLNSPSSPDSFFSALEPPPARVPRPRATLHAPGLSPHCSVPSLTRCLVNFRKVLSLNPDVRQIPHGC